MNTRILYIFFSLLLAVSLNAQDDETPEPKDHRLKVITRTIDNRVEIRWAPGSRELWNIANAGAYVLERRDSDNAPWQRLASLKPYTLEEWKSKADTTDVYVATAAQALLGPTTIDFQSVTNIQEAIRLAEEQDAKFAFALLCADYSKQAAEGLAFRFEDRNIQVGKVYTYRLFIDNFRAPPNSGILADTVLFSVITSRKYEAPKVVNAGAEAGDGEIILTWDRQFNDKFFSGFWIERSDDGGKKYKRLNELPHQTSRSVGEGNHHVFIDTGLVNYKDYRYRIIGITPFSDESKPSDVISVQSVDLSGPMPPYPVKASDNGNGAVLISWEAIVNTADHAGFLVERAITATGPYELLTPKPLSKSTRSFIDKTALPIVANYYIVYAVDDKGNRNGSSPVVSQWEDTIPPAKPKNLTGIVDSSGIVTLVWDLGMEPDLLGYRVFFSNAPNREFFQITTEPVKGNIFFDSIPIETLSKKVYYYIVAVDFNYNPSDASDILELDRPDVIPPQSPVLSGYSSDDDAIYLVFRPSTSSDVVKHTLWRASSGQEDWQALATLGKADSAYADQDVSAGSRYSYAVTATDDSGLESPYSNVLAIDAVDRGLRPGVGQLNGQFIKAEKALALSWTFTGPADCRFLLMRSDGNGGYSPLANLAGDAREYRDLSLYQNPDGFEYVMQVLYPDGGSSALSNKVTIMF